MALTVAQIDTAIEEILTKGQSHSIDGTTFTAANLPGLTELRERVMNTTTRSAGSRPVFRTFNMSGAAND